MGFLGKGEGVGWWLSRYGHCVHIERVGVHEKITERLIADTLEGTVYYLRQSVGARNVDRCIPKDKLTHIHNRQKKSIRHYMCRPGIKRDGKIICVHNTTQNRTLSNFKISHENYATTYTRHIQACTLLKYFPTHLERWLCGTNYAKNAHTTSIGIPVGHKEAGCVLYRWI